MVAKQCKNPSQHHRNNPYPRVDKNVSSAKRRRRRTKSLLKLHIHLSERQHSIASNKNETSKTVDISHKLLKDRKYKLMALLDVVYLMALLAAGTSSTLLLLLAGAAQDFFVVGTIPIKYSSHPVCLPTHPSIRHFHGALDIPPPTPKR